MDIQIEEKYQKALKYIYSNFPMFSVEGASAYKPGLETSHKLDSHYNHPHNNFKSIHIGGTNGKGSSSNLIASILQSQGYKVGLYTSPHLIDFRERMRINGNMIPKEEVIDFVEKWQKNDYNGSPSFFEFIMMMAFVWFSNENIDYAVIEVGMGGRLDSTNIITPILSVITNISNDHNQFLGDTIPDIAVEKAGIIKKKVPVIIGERQIECENVFINTSKINESPLFFASDKILAEFINESEDGGWNFNYKGTQIYLPLGGEYQKKNLNTTLHAIEILKSQGINISHKAIKEGIEKIESQTGFSGRWTILSHKPLIIADTGHNYGGLSYNFNQLTRLLEKRTHCKLRIVIGFVADKDIDIIMTLLPNNAIYYVTNASIPRALSYNELYERFKKNNFTATAFPNVEKAYQKAKNEASDEDIIYIGGSTFIVADLFKYLKSK